jgi:hypothetical protein
MFNNIVAKFINVSGVCEGFVKDAIRTNPILPLPFISTTPQAFYSQNLRAAFFKEVNSYLDKAIYQYILSKELLNKGNFSWGAVTQYYANFFAISGLIRLHEHGFSRIESLDVEVQYQPNDRTYRIKKINVKGLHRVVWSTFYSLYNGFDYKPHIFYIVYSPLKSNNFYYESDRRNDINYNPATGYNEIYQTFNAINNLIKERTKDTYSKDRIYQTDEWSDLDNITQYRIRLLGNIIFEIDKLTDLPTYAKERSIKRKNIIHRCENKKYRERIIGWLEGE